MNKEEILAKSRQENQNKDLEKLEADSKAGALACIISAIYAAVMWFTELFLSNGGSNYNYSLWAVVTVMNATIQLYMYAKLKQKKNLIAAIPWLLMSVGLTIAAIISSIPTEV